MREMSRPVIGVRRKVEAPCPYHRFAGRLWEERMERLRPGILKRRAKARRQTWDARSRHDDEVLRMYAVKQTTECARRVLPRPNPSSEVRWRLSATGHSLLFCPLLLYTPYRDEVLPRANNRPVAMVLPVPNCATTRRCSGGNPPTPR